MSGSFAPLEVIVSMDPTDMLQGGAVSIPEQTYAVCRTEGGSSAAFATIRDESETTVVVEQDAVDSVDATEVERGWKRLTFEMDLPFELVGFLAAVATALSRAEVPIFVLSSYSTDHVLVKSGDLDTAVAELERLGCDVTR